MVKWKKALPDLYYLGGTAVLNINQLDIAVTIRGDVITAFKIGRFSGLSFITTGAMPCPEVESVYDWGFRLEIYTKIHGVPNSSCFILTSFSDILNFNIHV